MLRFRNRFKGESSELHTCPCGLRITMSVTPETGRQTIIHELPWCKGFAKVMRDLTEQDRSSQLHHAAVVIDPVALNVQTVVVADGDRIEDVDSVPDIASGVPN